ncbi:HPr kinase/phosphorylase [Marivita sp.]|uniref:HPr kinase/phosphorylase n=1 Tax=Marivita sp. TaxID=2003365 RepID=UPI0025BC28F1|nr:HPr kinase/phosphatase C-terminal domain-containing protein [Marivita sp.]
MSDADTQSLHATAVALHGGAALMIGASGSGKSSLALEMMARGATLVADDRVLLTLDTDRVLLSCPDTLRGLIEARGVGLLHADHQSPASLRLVIDMDQTETRRLPPDRIITYFTKTFPLLHKVETQHFPAAVLQYLRSDGRSVGPS